MAAALLSLPAATRHETPVSQRSSTSSSCLIFHRSLSVASIKCPYNNRPTVLLCSAATSVSVVEDVSSPLPPDAAATEGADKVGFSGCKVCGKEELEKGCNGEGSIQGGIATVPGFGWWPIKAYRPCPGFLASGGRYRRQGQTMDEVAFGRGEKRAPVSSDSENIDPSKSRGGRKFKR
ncbi:hypothetical protein AB3S75_025137 [Citrus x aurantiifolia]